MIRGVHTMFYSSEPEALRMFLRDKLGFPATDIGGGLQPALFQRILRVGPAAFETQRHSPDMVSRWNSGEDTCENQPDRRHHYLVRRPKSGGGTGRNSLAPGIIPVCALLPIG